MNLQFSICTKMTVFMCRYFKGRQVAPCLKYMPKYLGDDFELRIGRCKVEDAGEYLVKAVNSFGSREESANLTVECKAL